MQSHYQRTAASPQRTSIYHQDRASAALQGIDGPADYVSRRAAVHRRLERKEVCATELEPFSGSSSINSEEGTSIHEEDSSRDPDYAPTDSGSSRPGGIRTQAQGAGMLGCVY